MNRKLELVREKKLFRLLPGRTESSRLEASGVALLDDKTALVIFDNLNWIARVDLSLQRAAGNRLLPAPSLGSGFEDIAVDRTRSWATSHRFRLPMHAEFEDYAALAYRDRQLAVVSQASARLWVARVDERAQAVVPGSEARYRFPNKSYRNIEGIAWLSRDTLVAVSDRKKASQPDRCAEQDQSIHVFRIPAG